MANIRCQHCGFSTDRVPDQHLGKKVKCPKCKGSGVEVTEFLFEIEEDDQQETLPAPEPVIIRKQTPPPAMHAAKPQAKAMPVTARAEKPKLWNPEIAAILSMFFTPMLGPYTVWVNWKTLGIRNIPSVIWNYLFFIIFVAVTVSLSFMQIAKYADSAAIVAGISFFAAFAGLIVWYLTCAKKQIAYIKENIGEYEKKGWIGTVIMFLMIAVFMPNIVGGYIIRAYQPENSITGIQDAYFSDYPAPKYPTIRTAFEKAFSEPQWTYHIPSSSVIFEGKISNDLHMLLYETLTEKLNEDDAVSEYMQKARIAAGTAWMKKAQEDVMADSDMALGDTEIERRVVLTFIHEFIFPEGTPVRFIFTYAKDGKNFSISEFKSTAFTGFDLNKVLKFIYANAVK